MKTNSRRERLLASVAERLVRPRMIQIMRFVPVMPRAFKPKRWPADPQIRVPENLRSTPGIRRDRQAEENAFAEGPMPEFGKAHSKAIHWAHQMMWRSWIPSAPRLMRAFHRVRTAPTAPSHARTHQVDAADLTAELRSVAAAAGISTIGITNHDEKYTWAPYLGQAPGDKIVVCILEQPYEPTQTAPSGQAERAALRTYAELMNRALAVGRFLRERGYQANVNDIRGHGASLHYAVEAGLGQLGLNGQLLTPAAGSRCRILMINTDAPLTIDHPVDYGIEKICDNCLACVERCPSGAIPARRDFHRGVYKAKINTKRCLPVVAQVDGCAVCMKVCPVQRYGLPAVLDHFEKTDTILGRGTDELEGYGWPLDDQRYGPGQKPRLTREFFEAMPERFDNQTKSTGDDTVAFL
ncbi:4Fe-4S dicluster domain-containing protein [Polymorphospora lycopeni]|uniref:Reductive dehalogenase domain-containing protein n=1 Tax=Polymorphospora lycopeni TaxID=3140240 RepID=A0ABV5CMM8_9ACTN